MKRRKLDKTLYEPLFLPLVPSAVVCLAISSTWLLADSPDCSHVGVATFCVSQVRSCVRVVNNNTTCKFREENFRDQKSNQKIHENIVP